MMRGGPARGLGRARRSDVVFKRILLEYDDSDLTHRAFEWCLRLAGDWGSHLAVIGVIRPSEAALDFGAQVVLDQRCDQLAGQIAQLQRRARLAGVEMSALIRLGDPVHETLCAAQELRADLIVAGCAARKLWPHFLLPTATARLIAMAHCAVLVVR